MGKLNLMVERREEMGEGFRLGMTRALDSEGGVAMTPNRGGGGLSGGRLADRGDVGQMKNWQMENWSIGVPGHSGCLVVEFASGKLTDEGSHKLS
jgi:hypothetical protein